MKKEYREFWIEHKLFIDEWVYEAYETNEERTNKDLTPIHVIEHAAYTDLLTEARKLREALEIEMGNSGTRQAEEALSNFDAKYPEVKE